MTIKFSVSTVALVAFLSLTHSAIASAEAYKTSKDQVVVTGLTAKQSYPIQAVNAKNKTRKLKDKFANTCGELILNGAAKYKSLVVGTETIDPTTLPVKTHANCKGKKSTTAKSTTKKTTTTVTTGTTTPATGPMAPSSTTDPSTIIPATTK